MQVLSSGPWLESGGEDPGGIRSLVGMEPMDWLIVKTDPNGSFRYDSLPEDCRAGFIVTAPGKGIISTRDEGEPGEVLPRGNRHHCDHEARG